MRQRSNKTAKSKISYREHRTVFNKGPKSTSDQIKL